MGASLAIGLLVGSFGAAQPPFAPSREDFFPPHLFYATVEAASSTSFSVVQTHVGPKELNGRLFTAEYVPPMRMGSNFPFKVTRGMRALQWLVEDPDTGRLQFYKVPNVMLQRAFAMEPVLTTDRGYRDHSIAAAILASLYHATDEERLNIVNECSRSKDLWKQSVVVYQLVINFKNPKALDFLDGLLREMCR